MKSPVPFRWGVLMIAAVALTTVWAGYAQTREALLESQKRDAVAGAQTVARAYESSTNRTLHEIDGTLRNFAARHAEGGLNAARRIIDDALYDASLIHHVSVFDRSGALVFRSGGEESEDSLGSEGLLAFHQGEGRSRMQVGLPQAEPGAGRSLLRFSRRLDEAGGGFAGIVVAYVDSDGLSDFYRQAGIGPQGVVTLVGFDTIIRARGTASGTAGVGRSLAESALWPALRASPTGVYWQNSVTDGQHRAYAYRKIPDYPLVIAVGAALADMEAAAKGLLRHLQIIAVLIGLSVATVAGFLLIQHRNAERLEAALAVNRDFLARVSHELRTPLNAILGFSEIIKEQMLGPQAGPRYIDYAKDIHASGQRLLTMIDDILDLSRLQAGRMALHLEPVDPVAAVEWAARIVAPQAEQKNIQVTINRPPASPDIIADERALKQMLLNLLTNAVTFTPPDGRIHITVGRAPNGRCVVRVTDTGVGMTAEQLRQAVVPFGQTSALTTHQGQGTGLGLPIVKSLIEAHGGHLKIHSRPGQGSQITLEFAG